MMSSLEEQPPFKQPSSPIERIQLDSAASFITPSPKKNHGDGDQFVDDKPFIDKTKSSSTTVLRGVLNNGEHTGNQFVQTDDCIFFFSGRNQNFPPLQKKC